MKKLLLPFCLLLTGISLLAQSPWPGKPADATPVRVTWKADPAGTAALPFKEKNLFARKEKVAGTTFYDVQSYASLGQRIADLGNGRAGAAWHYGTDQANNYPNRGVAHNNFDGYNWGTLPSDNIESVRSGFPSYTAATDGTEYTISHQTAASSYVLDLYRKRPADSGWQKRATLPTSVPGGPVWSKIAAGGNNGSTLHVIAISVAPEFGGVIHQGINGHPLYYRSLDGGATWDKADTVIPGLDSSAYNIVEAETYLIDARGNTVAIAVVTSWGDVAVFKSTDNGDTWTKTIVKDFPLDKFDDSYDYLPDDVPDDPNAPDDIAILSSDGSGSLVIDNDGKLHLFFGWMYVEGYGGQRFYFPTMNGLAYWNEDFGPENIETIAGALDYNGDGVLNLTNDNIAYYSGSSLSTQPNAGVDADNYLYLIYSAVREDYVDQDELNYRHIYLIKSEDGGLNWSEPFDLINDKTIEDPFFVPFIEGVFPALPPRIGNTLHLIYQQDYIPGMATFPTPGYEATENLIMHMELDKVTFDPYARPSSTEEQGIEADLSIAPNPTEGLTALRFRLSGESNVRLQALDLSGREIFSNELGRFAAGAHTERVDFTAFGRGFYLLKIETDEGYVTRKVVVR